MKEILINVEEEEKRIAFVENKKLEEFYIEREEGEQLVGNIYKGRVDNVASAIQAAFVHIGLEKNGFLHLSDVEPETALAREMEEEEVRGKEPQRPAGTGSRRQTITDLFAKDQELIVQVFKAPIGTKGVRLTTNISIPGRHIVLMPNTSTRGVSRKITDRGEKIRLKKMLSGLKIPAGMGLILRTAASGINTRNLQRELNYLLSTWKRIQRRIKITRTPGCVHSELGLVLRTVRDSLTENVNKVVIDSRREYKLVRKFVSIFLSEFKSRIEFYNEVQPLFDKNGIEKEIEKIFYRRTWLKCGGYLIFDPTEALVTIDVNSGKFVKTKDMEETAFKTNMEAASEIGRQLRLRNMGGIIIIDFIDMDNISHQRAVLKELKGALKRDKAKINVYPFSRLGLVELTRQRIKERISREVFQPCPYCKGSARVKSVETIMLEIKRKLREWNRRTRGRAVTITAHPDVVKYLEEGDFIHKWHKALRIRMRAVADQDLHREMYKIS